jgi:serine/threonine protein kinase
MGVRVINISLLQHATSNFDEKCKIGQGGFGSVYRATLDLPQGPTQVAIKRLSSDSQQGHAEFTNEVKLLASFDHPHIVPVLGFVSSAGEQCIVTPLFQHGSLRKALDSGDPSTFTAFARVGACLDVALGLKYLHQRDVWHLDLKPANVLTTDLRGIKRFSLIDFGLAKQASEALALAAKSHITTQTIVGTHNYIAPEFMTNGHMSAACDVYSFGQLVLVTVTGLPPYIAAEHIALAEYAQDVMDDHNRNPAQVTRALSTTSCSWTFPGAAEIFIQLISLGIDCANRRPKRRPSLVEVETRLRTILDTLHQSFVKECLVCMTEPRAMINLPCRHAVACTDCAEILRVMGRPCPVCRTPIHSFEAAQGPIQHTFVRRT